MDLKTQVERLQTKLETLRGAMIRNHSGLHEQVDQTQWEAKRLLNEAEGTDFVPALQSICSLLDCLRRGMDAQADLNALRTAG
jgi:hypothetical protein